MQGFRLASGCRPRALRFASRVQRLVEALPGAPRVVGVPAAEGGPAGSEADRLGAMLMSREADGAVCAASDLPEHIPAGIVLGAILPSRDARYRCVSRSRPILSLLPPGSRVAVWDEAARAQVLALHPGFKAELVRGREDLAPGLRHGLWAAACLPADVIEESACWGLFIETVAAAELLPDAGQGAAALLVLESSLGARRIASALNDAPARRCVSAERTFAREAAGIPGTVAAAHAVVSGGMIDFNGLIADADGRWLAMDGARAESGFGEIVAREVADACRELARRRLTEFMSLRKAAAF